MSVADLKNCELEVQSPTHNIELGDQEIDGCIQLLDLVIPLFQDQDFLYTLKTWYHSFIHFLTSNKFMLD